MSLCFSSLLTLDFKRIVEFFNDLLRISHHVIQTELLGHIIFHLIIIDGFFFLFVICFHLCNLKYKQLCLFYIILYINLFIFLAWVQWSLLRCLWTFVHLFYFFCCQWVEFMYLFEQFIFFIFFLHFWRFFIKCGFFFICPSCQFICHLFR